MSFQGAIEVQCPSGCEAFTAEVWSYIRGDDDSALRMAVLARECNLLLCSQCGIPFFPEASYVYAEPKFELLAFVFPESYREREGYWREKMAEDFRAMRSALGEKMPIDLVPDVFFGPEGLAELLEREDLRGAEQAVLEHYARDLGLELYRVGSRWTRERGLPRAWPYAGARPTRDALIVGLEKALAANDRLSACARALEALRAPGATVPPSAARVS